MRTAAPAIKGHAIGHPEIMGWRLRECGVHVGPPDGSGDHGPGLLIAQGLGIIETHPHDGHQVRGEARKPGIVEILTGPRLARNGRSMLPATGLPVPLTITPCIILTIWIALAGSAPC